MYIAFFSLIIIYIAFFIFVIYKRISRFQDRPVTEKIKLGTYYYLICGLWGGTSIVLIICLIARLNFDVIGIKQLNFNYGFWFTSITLILCGLLFFSGLYQLISSLLSKKYKEAAEKQYGNHIVLSGILPRTKKEKWLFVLLSLSAGICEEIIFRGFLLYLLQAIFPNIPLFLITLITCTLFGISHFYQRLQGIIVSMIFGVLFMSLYIVTGSLILPIFLHFFQDFSSTFTLSEKQK